MPSFLFISLLLSFIHFSFSLPSIGIPNVRLPDADPSLIKAFAFTNTSLFLSIPNPLLPAVAANRSLALRWLYRHVLPFYPRSKITLISVGNAVLDSVAEQDFTPYLLPAMRNLHLALHELETNSSFLINLYPYNLYRLNSEIPVGFALFQDYPFNFRDDLVTGVRYFNLFDMMADSVLTAMAVMGYESVPVIVAETGWPSGGGEAGEVEANEAYAEMYLKGLVRHLKSGVGTPLKKDGVAEVYVYELMDHEGGNNDNNKVKGRKWGILTENMTRKFNVEISSGVKNYGLMGIFLFLIAIFYAFP
ncbi:hypothetical protein GOBAR_DD30074 [Gossypium barbadense]|nr:hypothetical protein GOBAR_DD30074 [Gossypium barbadense]